MPRPAARLLGFDQPRDRRARGEHKSDALLDVGQLAFPRAHERRAHRAWRLTLRPEHVAVDRKRLLVAEQVGEAHLAFFTFEHVALRHLAARRQFTAKFRDALDVAAQLDLLDQEALPGAPVFSAFTGEMSLVGAREFRHRFQDGTVHGMTSVAADIQ